MSKIISIEGNIGSGKSTLLSIINEKFKNMDNIIFLQEPVEEWESIKDSNGVNILTKFYEDQKRYSFTFQIMAYISRLNILKKAIETNPDAIIISERSLYTDRYVFAKMLYDSGNLEDIEYQIYLKWFDHFIDNIKFEKIVYLKTDPVTCFERINKRNRTGESSISIEYLLKCHLYHQKMIEDNNMNSGRDLTLKPRSK
jgi:deoxyadenosine/deoxycytidine kinase